MEVNNRQDKRVLVRQKQDQWRRRKFKCDNDSSVRCQATPALLLTTDGFNVGHPDVFLNIYTKCRFSQSYTSNLLLKTHSRQHVLALQSHHQNFLQEQIHVIHDTDHQAFL
jgi:hypothetical protein